MKSYRCILAMTAPLIALQACAIHRPGGVSAQMMRTEAAIQQADSTEFANSPDELNVAKEKFMHAKVELDSDSFGGDRRARALAKTAEERAKYAAAHPKTVTQADWLVPAPASFMPGSAPPVTQ
jgi:hypothetical protein